MLLISSPLVALPVLPFLRSASPQTALRSILSLSATRSVRAS
jgi:hypothetical protein